MLRPWELAIIAGISAAILRGLECSQLPGRVRSSRCSHAGSRRARARCQPGASSSTDDSLGRIAIRLMELAERFGPAAAA
jgi:hypothetical protein